MGGLEIAKQAEAAGVVGDVQCGLLWGVGWRVVTKEAEAALLGGLNGWSLSSLCSLR